MFEPMNHHISDILAAWYNQNKRDLPWRETKDPYKIWLSEIILQQTRVAQGLPYYEKFVKKFPTVSHLASADEQIVLRLWQGLGYYSRARNLHQCAKTIVADYNGEFPRSANELKKLKGIGDYTAAAIASFCFKEAVPVLDGNVFRVISRYFGVYDDIGDAKNKKIFYQLLNEVIDKEKPDLFNQAIMEFGALHCTPANPMCMYCKLQDSCYSFEHKSQNELPVKLKKVKVRQRYFKYLVFVLQNKIYLKKRTENDIWIGLYDFYLKETENETLEALLEGHTSSELILLDESKSFKHILTHQRIDAKFFVIKLAPADSSELFLTELTPYNLKELMELPKPKLIDNYINEVLSKINLE